VNPYGQNLQWKSGGLFLALFEGELFYDDRLAYRYL
jgi:hypothetical protein